MFKLQFLFLVASHKLNEVLAGNTEKNKKKAPRSLLSSLNIRKHSFQAFSSSYYTLFLRTIINKKTLKLTFH